MNYHFNCVTNYGMKTIIVYEYWLYISNFMKYKYSERLSSYVN